MRAKIALIVVSVALIASFAANAYFYTLQQNGLAADNDLQKQAANLERQIANLTNQTNSLQNKKTNLETQIATLENQIADLSNQANSLQTEKTNLQSENLAIQNHIDQVRKTGAPKIVTRLGATDVRQSPAAGHPWSGVIRLYIGGEVWNVGTGPALNCGLRVTLYQGNIVANETYVKLGTINAGSYTDVKADIYYAGIALTNWTIIPEFD